MSGQSDKHTEQVVAYYNRTKRDYRILWRSNRSLGIHFGYYDDQHRDHDAAVLNINRKLADLAGVSKHDIVLDAGCGIGGSALWLAAHRKCHTTGISIVPWQVLEAKRLAKQRGLQDKTRFIEGDFADTGLDAESFTLVWGLESVVHAEDKQAVISEAFRLLKPGGKLLIAEYMLTKSHLDSQEQADLDTWLTGWAMPSLLTERQYRKFMTKAGFTAIDAYDWTEPVRPSFDRLKKLVRVFKPLAPFLHRIGLANEGQLGNLAASDAQMQLLASGVWRYNVIIARKDV